MAFKTHRALTIITAASMASSFHGQADATTQVGSNKRLAVHEGGMVLLNVLRLCCVVNLQRRTPTMSSFSIILNALSQTRPLVAKTQLTLGYNPALCHIRASFARCVISVFKDTMLQSK
jgi:hypothetical protein